MTPYFLQEGITIYHSDCLTVLTSIPCDSVDAIVIDWDRARRCICLNRAGKNQEHAGAAIVGRFMRSV